MDNLDIVHKIETVCGARGLKTSALLRQAGLSPNVIEDWRTYKTEPSFPALFDICNVLNIDVKELFATDELQLTASQTEILNEWRALTAREKQAVFDYITAMKSVRKQ